MIASADKQGFGFLSPLVALPVAVVEGVGEVASNRLLTGHHFLRNGDSFFQKPSVPSITIILALLLILTNLG